MIREGIESGFLNDPAASASSCASPSVQRRWGGRCAKRWTSCAPSPSLAVGMADHPRTRGSIDVWACQDCSNTRIALLPQGYLEMLGLLCHARLTLTDSGGIQEEATALAVPCLTMRDNTERPITVEQGTNTLVGRNRLRILECVDDVLMTGGKRGKVPELWDGHTAGRIAAVLTRHLFE
jgi:UDP-N-acetylglucosamine 2-epimerase (non-hydrolysing)